jgi:hypothetical protein
MPIYSVLTGMRENNSKTRFYVHPDPDPASGDQEPAYKIETHPALAVEILISSESLKYADIFSFGLHEGK